MPNTAQARNTPISERSPVTTGRTESTSLTTRTFGGSGGNAFEVTPVRTLRLRTGSMVDQIDIDGQAHGGGGGGASPLLVLESGEFINRIEIRSGSRIDFVSFSTNRGQRVDGGGSGGRPTTLENIRLVAISGKSGSMVDSLTFLYEQN